jgi:hypothetical protein
MKVKFGWLGKVVNKCKTIQTSIFYQDNFNICEIIDAFIINIYAFFIYFIQYLIKKLQINVCFLSNY